MFDLRLLHSEIVLRTFGPAVLLLSRPQGVADIQRNLSLLLNAGAGSDLCKLIKVLYESKFSSSPSVQRNTPWIKMRSMHRSFLAFIRILLYSVCGAWLTVLRGRCGEVVSLPLLGNFTDHPQGKTHLRMITDNVVKMFTLLLWGMMTHVDAVGGQKKLDYPEICSHCEALPPIYTVHIFVNAWFCALSFTTHSLFLWLSTGYGECLLDEPVGRTYELPTLLPGQIYNANRQCELMFGPGSQICPYMVNTHWTHTVNSLKLVRSFHLQRAIVKSCGMLMQIYRHTYSNYYSMRNYKLKPVARRFEMLHAHVWKVKYSQPTKTVSQSAIMRGACSPKELKQYGRK